ncbi:MAG: formate--phosphoribosylaminoimidazolecarboxamide ligase [Candidatus Methanosuratincola sp.]|jgi:5-formaminoimidazole-4-carboxamide-1-(beta)-D-ribofuranosyl 5'-monophosphate synthetase|nr:formate--phosphoribosylaminoimidazolecarboxamide ligase [Candidatus Methanosuratincola sp.]
MPPTVAVIGSHSALQILRGAKQEGLRTLLICLKGRESLYGRFRLADRTVSVGSVEEILGDDIQDMLDEEGAIFVPHGTLISGGRLEDLEKRFRPRIFGNRFIFKWEYDRELKDRLLKEAGIRTPKKISSYSEIDGPAIVKLPGAEGGRGYFIAKSPRDFEAKIMQLTGKGLIRKGEEEKVFIQEYIIGVPLYPHYFWSAVEGRIELMGCDRRYETSIDAIGRISAQDQLELGITPTFRVIGNMPLVLRESLLMDIFDDGEKFVSAAKRLVPPGMIGPFCLEMICDEEGKLYTFEFSGRIVAGTNLFVSGSPYSDLLFDEPMSMGRRIAREIKAASELGEIEKVTT